MDIDAVRASPMSQVLELPELLELVLSYLPRMELLLAQRTSRLWQQVISSSPLLQKMLFLQPDWKLEGHYADDKPGSRPLNNLMLRKIMGGMYPTMTLQRLLFTTKEDFEFAKKASNLLGFWAWNINVSFPADALLSAQSCDPAIGYEKASWRRMFVSQPPATSLHLTRRWQRSALPVIEAKGGVTMQDLVNGADQKRSRWNEVYISSDRDWHLEGPIKYSHFLGEKGKQKVAE
ncbi:hypothetical protein K461DRAFT_224967 [Myriangium duriaei CBS 260.36]|uniref:F-box domain-containing protein n=1 Tax=Myriangium duriaei CBS 260.36 TaxID=1168546 RepID=A0A9P4J207_9PEZI|nr:hypothetical protein K461DRAFT_224967 [Myriangium duriaei CBS 260.36]